MDYIEEKLKAIAHKKEIPLHQLLFNEFNAVSYNDYDEFLDELYPECTIAGNSYCTSRALHEVDPIAYRCGFSDFTDSEEQNETFVYLEDEYYHRWIVEKYIEENLVEEEE